ncbi:MAG: glycosyltransferase family 4 protein [Erysipelotrichaceae bacterium]|uniref:Glycosyltransferase n=1 Tax=Copranaerobaculum intestinale TaxID=2692629 RepID=A0A6N8U4Z0_9FIRM|nr:glycosyltransferase family 4 protein [Copranaerobaculum intestinale]MBS6374728.1 glycosyltransferase family 4 protein [Erysipelotrichaceae bacterium]MXQ73142.1 glycosyltransferase [Copranaerobaculum intestinale]
MILDNRIVINMLSSADKIEGQGVGSAYLEQVKLVSEGAPDLFDVRINSIKAADINHAHTVDPQNYVKMKMNNAGANVCYVHFLPDTLNGSIQLPKALFAVFKKYVVSFYKAADYLIVVNPTFMDELEKYGIPREKMVYIPNYVSKEDFYEKPRNERNLIRQKYGIAEDAFVVIGVGQVQTRKGVLDFVDVAKRLPDIQFVWCGGFSFGAITDGYAELKEVVENPPANVKFLGIIPRQEMNDFYNLADVLFMPSYNELFPMAILEAVNLKRPLVLRDLELYEDILFHKYQNADDNEGFSNLIRKLHEDPDYYRTCAQESGFISEYYSKENVLKIWKEFYTRVYEEQLSQNAKAQKRKQKLAKRAFKEAKRQEKL